MIHQISTKRKKKKENWWKNIDKKLFFIYQLFSFEEWKIYQNETGGIFFLLNWEKLVVAIYICNQKRNEKENFKKFLHIRSSQEMKLELHATHIIFHDDVKNKKKLQINEFIEIETYNCLYDYQRCTYFFGIIKNDILTDAKFLKKLKFWGFEGVKIEIWKGNSRS